MKKYICLAACALLALSAGAEELNFFLASKAGEEAWSWGEGRVRKDGTVLRIEEASDESDYGDVFVSDKFPYFPDGIVKIDVSKIGAGAYTFQILGFQGGANTFTATPLKNSEVLDIQTIRLSDLGFPLETQTILFKLWALGAESAAFDLRELLYSKIVNLESPLLHEGFEDPARWTMDAAALTLSNGTMRLQPGTNFAAMAFAERLPFRPDLELILRVAGAGNGMVTLQMEAFNEAGEFLGPADVIKDAGAGYHGARFSQIRWPQGTGKVGIKLWLAGNEGASATLDQLIVYPPQ